MGVAAGRGAAPTRGRTPRVLVLVLVLVLVAAGGGAMVVPTLAGASPRWPAAASTRRIGQQDPPALVDAAVTVDASAGGDVYVEIRYRVRPGAEVVVPLELVLPEGVTVAGVSARVWEDPVPVDLALGDGPAPRGRIVLPEGLRAGEVPLFLRYRVPGGLAGEDGDVILRVPLLAVGWPPAEALPGTFTASVRLAGELRVTGGFPSGWSVESAGSGGSEVFTLATTELPVLPALVSVRARGAGSGPGPTLAQVLGGLVLLVLGVVAAAGVRHLREVA